MLTTRSSATIVVNSKITHEIWPDNDFVNSCHEFGRTKKPYMYSLSNVKVSIGSVETGQKPVRADAYIIITKLET